MIMETFRNMNLQVQGNEDVKRVGLPTEKLEIHYTPKHGTVTGVIDRTRPRSMSARATASSAMRQLIG